MHVAESFVNLGKRAVVSDVFVDLNLASQVVCTDNQIAVTMSNKDNETYLPRALGVPCGP